MKGKRRSPAEISRDRRRISDLYLQGLLQSEIAEQLEVGQATVSRDLKALRDEWLEDSKANFDEAKSRELAKIDRLEREYWQAWGHSCKDAETLRQEGDPKQPPTKVVKTSKGQAGDPRFLQGVQWCIERRCKILGVDAPQKLNIDVRQLSDSQLERIAKGENPTYVLAVPSTS